MRKEEEVVEVHPEGELQISGNQPPELGASVDTFAGKVNVRWVPEAAVSGLGLMVFFIEFLKRSEEHTSELQSPMYLVCRLLLEKKNMLTWLVSRPSPPAGARLHPSPCLEH